MAYYLVSLVEILDQISHPNQHNQNWILDPDMIPQIQSLLEHTSFLRDGFATSERLSRSRIESLEDRLKDMVETMEDDIVTCQIRSSSCQSDKISLPDFKEEIRVFESAKQEMTEIINASWRPTNQRLDYASPIVSSRRDPNPKNMVVGVTEDLNQLRDRLIGKSSSKLEIIPIVGMGGSGKTTLARILYNEFSFSKSHFDICAWVTISQDYNPRGILQNLVNCVTMNPTTMQEIGQLRDSLHKSLFSRRYFIVLDDIWSSEAWDVVQTAFPHENENKGSRIILTTRGNNLANYVQSKSHQMRLLNEDDSWDLLRKKVYGEESCPCELEEIGKKIAKNCKRLPLALQVIGGLLSHAERSKDFWEQVASDVTSCIANEDEQFSGIFSLSYAHLPHYLKPCFLYMGIFPEDYTIKASKLIKLWVAESFLCPVGDKSSEEIAGIYLKMLLDRNLIFAREKNWAGKVKSYGIHDLLRDLCMKKAEEKKLIWVKNLKDNNLSEDTLRVRRVCVHSLPDKYKHVSSSVKLTPFARSILTIGVGRSSHKYILSFLCFDLSLLRVLDVLEILFPTFPKEILQLVNLRYLALLYRTEFPDNIYVLRNLQTLIIGNVRVGPFYIPPGIFDIPQLRHLHFTEDTPGLQAFDFDRSFAVQEKLQSLCTVPLDMLKRFFLGKIPNLRKLGITCPSFPTDSANIFDLTCFNKLETLKCSHCKFSKLPNLVFPDSLRKLTLWYCTVTQTFMNTIGMLPNLEALKLRDILLENFTWQPYEGEFCKLQYLQLRDVNLENWLADETHFPMLQHLVIELCDCLKEIPREIGGIATLEIIEVDERSRMAMDSARRIIEEQHYLGNDLLQIRVGRKSRFYSQQWRTWAAYFIQAAWRRYTRKKLEKASREEENRLHDALAKGGSSSLSLGATIYALRFAANALRLLRRNSTWKARMPEWISPMLLEKPDEPDFKSEDKCFDECGP